MVQKKHIEIKTIYKPVLLICIILVLFITSYAFGWIDALLQLQPFIQNQGIWAPLIFIALFVLLAVAAIPATPLGIAAGALFGSVAGVLIVSVASTLAASIAFLIARYIAHDSIQRWIQTKTRMKHFYDLVEKQGALVVAITRLVPFFPYNLLNYALGLTNVSFRTYVFWTWLCMLPGTIVIVVGSDAILNMLTTRTIPWVLLIILAVAMLALISTSWMIKKHVKPPVNTQP